MKLNNPIYQLIYMSKAVTLMDTAALIQLLNKARELNAAHQISGMLLYAEIRLKSELQGRFIQVLEGQPDAVEQLFNNIRVDARHRHVTLLHRRFVTERDFPDWTMGFQILGEADTSVNPGFFALNEAFLRSGSRSNAALDFLKDFYALKMTVGHRSS